jgi:hypothetical protein
MLIHLSVLGASFLFLMMSCSLSLIGHNCLLLHKTQVCGAQVYSCVSGASQTFVLRELKAVDLIEVWPEAKIGPNFNWNNTKAFLFFFKVKN